MFFSYIGQAIKRKKKENCSLPVFIQTVKIRIAYSPGIPE
jgi:hypothetical protein